MLLLLTACAVQKEKYDLSSQLLGAKNEVCELEIKLHDAEEQASKSKDDAESARRERDDMQVGEWWGTKEAGCFEQTVAGREGGREGR